MDALRMRWERRVVKDCYVVRYVIPDSSPQGHWNYFCEREDRLVFPTDDFELMRDIILDANRLESVMTSRSMVPTTLGRGEAGVNQKTSHFCHSMLCETGADDGDINKRRDSYRGAASDSGAEKYIFDVPNVLEGGVESTRQVLQDLQTGDRDVEDMGTGFLFPNLLYFPGVLHMLCGAFEEACKKADGWKKFEECLRAITNLLCDKSLRKRFVHLCLADVPGGVRALFNTWSHKHLQWRWDQLENVLDDLVQILWALQQYFSVEKMVAEGTTAERAASTAAVVILQCADA